MKKKVLFLGGEGFIGKNLIDFLASFFYCISVGVTQSVFESEQEREFLQGDVYKKSLDLDYDVVVHLIDNQKIEDEFLTYEKRLVNNINLKKGRHLILFSSSVIYANPDSDYGKRKIALEKFYSDYCQKNDIKLTIVRPFNIFGPYQMPFRQGSLMANVLYNYLNGKETVIINPNLERDFFYAKDIGKFINNIIENQTEGIIDVGSGVLTAFYDLEKALKKITGDESLLIKYGNQKDEVVPPISKGKLVRDVKLTELEKSLKETLGFYEKNIKIINKLIDQG